ncbi:MAG: Gfo/Idh/MocA family oxidoreductase [Vicinamibacterales bacterium]
MIGVGIIGYGYWGPNLVRNFVETPGCRVVSVSDLNSERLTKVRQRYPTIDTAADYRDLLNDKRIDLVAIATPVSTHFELAMQALRMGKHVLLEKPMTADVEQAMRLVDEAERRGLMLAVDHTFVYTGAVRKMKQLVSSGDLGDIYYYDSVRVNLGLFQHDVNVIWDLAVHDLSIMDHVLEAQPVAVSATGLCHVPGEPENIGYVTFHFAEPVMAHVHVNWLAPVKVRRTLIGGSRKMIVYDDLEPSEKVKVYDKGITVNGGQADPNGQRYAMLVGYRTGDVWAPQLEGAEALGVETRHLIECIQKKQTPIADGHAGLRVVRLLDAATQSLRANGRVIELSTSGVPV